MVYGKILVALDGSDYSLAGGEIAIKIARSLGSELLACHIYDARLHSGRFNEMERDLPNKYREEDSLTRLREAHKELIFEGFEALSKGYMEGFEKKARDVGVSTRQVHRQGRNYVELIELAAENGVDLIVLGAYGLGKADEGGERRDRYPLWSGKRLWRPVLL